MSRWSKRTQEEKEQILQKQQQQQEDQQTKKDKMNYVSTDWKLKILKDGEIPLFCKKHGWTHSNKYVLTKKGGPFEGMFGKTPTIVGNCRECNTELECMVPVNSVYTLLFATVISNLRNQNRLEDRR